MELYLDVDTIKIGNSCHNNLALHVGTCPYCRYKNYVVQLGNDVETKDICHHWNGAYRNSHSDYFNFHKTEQSTDETY